METITPIHPGVRPDSPDEKTIKELKGLLYKSEEKYRRTFDNLVASELQYRRLFESAKDGIIILDAESGMIMDVNPFLINLLDYTKEQFIEKKIWEIGFFKDIIANYDKFLELQKIEYVRYEHLPLESAKGRKISVEFVSNVYIVNNKKVIQCNIRDITKHDQSEKEFQESEERFRMITENSPDAIFITNKEGRYLYVNPKSINMLGYSNEELLSFTIVDIVPKDKLEVSIQQFTQLLQKGSSYIEIDLIKRNGDIIPVDLNAVLLPNGFVYASCRDITERKHAENELFESKEKAVSANKLKDAFIANISHEIRTPLNGIMGMASLIKETFHDKVKPEDEELFEGIDISSKRIMRTVDMILNYSRMQVGEFPVNKELIGISLMCINLVKEYITAAKFKSLELKFRNDCGEVKLFTDKYATNMAISNLIDNAIKYTKSGAIDLILHKDINDNIILDVKDTGIGISEEFLENIFDPYRQEQMGYGRAYEGVGLGLSLVKSIMSLNNAVISVQSKKGVGSVFSINFGKEISGTTYKF